MVATKHGTIIIGEKIVFDKLKEPEGVKILST